MKKVFSQIKQISKLNVESLEVVIKITISKELNYQNQVNNFDSQMKELDELIGLLPITYRRFDNIASINKNIKITFIY